MTQLQDDIRAVKALLDAPEKWTKGAYARDANGISCSWKYNKSAVCWCISGACSVIIPYTLDWHRRASRLERELEKYLPLLELVEWNDAPERTFEDIHNVLNAALDGCPQ
jgi:hypothetical protein